MYGPGGGGGGGGPRPFQQRGPSGIQRPALSDLPPNLALMFQPRPIIEFKKAPEERKLPPYTGISQYTSLFETAPAPIPQPFETPAEVKQRMKEKLEATNREKNQLLAGNWDPHNNSKATENAYLTLFVGRLSYDTTEKKLRREFEQFGPIKTIKIVSDLEGKARGYAFVEFEKEEDMTMAVKRWDGRKIDGRRVILDVERGRTVRNWRPMRFGGGLGGRKAMKSKKALEEEAALAGKTADKARQSQVYGPGGGDSRGSDRDRGGRDSDRGDDRGRAPDRRGRSRSRDRGPPPRDGGRDGGRDGSRGAPPSDSRYGPSSRDDRREGGRGDGGRDYGGGGGRDRGADSHYQARDGAPPSNRDSNRDAPRGGDRERERGGDGRGDRGSDSRGGGDRDRYSSSAVPRGREGLGSAKRERSRERR